MDMCENSFKIKTKRCTTKCKEYDVNSDCIYHMVVAETIRNYRWRMYRMRGDNNYKANEDLGRCTCDNVVMARTKSVKRRVSVGGVL